MLEQLVCCCGVVRGEGAAFPKILYSSSTSLNDDDGMAAAGNLTSPSLKLANCMLHVQSAATCEGAQKQAVLVFAQYLGLKTICYLIYCAVLPFSRILWSIQSMSTAIQHPHIEQ